MKRMHHKYGVLTLLVLALLLALSLAATPALAGDHPAVTMRATAGYYISEGVPGDATHWPDGTIVTDNWTPVMIVTATTGPEGWRFMGYAVACLTVIEPPTGHNYHWGEIVFTTDAPSAYPPDESTWLWKGTWNGVTLNKHNHLVQLDLTGYGEENDGLSASVAFHMNLWTNIQMVALLANEE
jgi:hypothetical protein